MSKRKTHPPSVSYDDWIINSLKDKKEAALYLQAALDEFQEDGCVEALMLSLRRIAEAQGGVGKLARRTHLNRETLYRTLSSKGNPKLQTVGSLLNALGFHLTVKCA
jgi:probable addiction module antidote protein